MYGKKLKDLRKIEGWTQKQVAEKLGVSKQTYSHYENENRKPGLPMIRKLAEVYQVDLDRVFGMDSLVKEADSNYEVNSSNVEMPLFGSIAAGALSKVEAITRSDVNLISMPKSLLGKYNSNTDLFGMKVNGESMNSIIPNGSTVIAKPIEYSELNNGDIVVYSFDGEYSMKRFRKTEDNKFLIFSPESSDKTFREMIIPVDTQTDLKIHGKIITYTVYLD